jgi:hypothetical protein
MDEATYLPRRVIATFRLSKLEYLALLGRLRHQLGLVSVVDELGD